MSLIVSTSYLCPEAGGRGKKESRGGGQEAQGGEGTADLYESEGSTEKRKRPRQRREGLAGFM